MREKRHGRAQTSDSPWARDGYNLHHAFTQQLPFEHTPDAARFSAVELQDFRSLFVTHDRHTCPHCCCR